MSIDRVRFLLIIVFVSLSASEALAYVDPGRSSLVQQVLASGMAGALVVARRALRSLLALIGFERNGARRKP